MVLAFPTIALEQLLHTDRSALATLPLYQALHWLSDSLLALPLAALAVWGAQRLATGLASVRPARSVSWAEPASSPFSSLSYLFRARRFTIWWIP